MIRITSKLNQYNQVINDIINIYGIWLYMLNWNRHLTYVSYFIDAYFNQLMLQ